MGDARGHGQNENGPRGDGKGADSDCDQTEGDNPPQGFRGVHDRPGRNLPQQSDEAAHGHEQPDINLRPFLGREENRDKRTESGLDVGDKEDQPIKTAARLSRAIAYPHRCDVVPVPQDFGAGATPSAGGACGPPMMTMGSPSL
jgi:hypothetical protein